MRFVLATILAGMTLAGTIALAGAQEVLTVGVQESGTVQWEIETIKRLRLDASHGVDLQIRPIAGPGRSRC